MPCSPQEFHKKMAIDKGKTDNFHNKKLGKEGEKRARSYLKRQGWKILEKNYKTPFGEIDIIAEKGEVVAFIEVKTRLSDIYGLPSEAVSNERKLRYIRGANYFFINKIIDCTVRFDIIEVFRGELNHIENAFSQ